MNRIVLTKVSIGYEQKIVAGNLSAEFRGGKLTALIGRNGLGKSTLLKVLTGFLPPLSGSVSIDVDGHSYDVAHTSKNVLARLISVVLTDKPDVDHLTVEEVVGMGRMPYTGFFGGFHAADRQIVAQAMASTSTTAFAHRDISELSDGERQKVMIARALAQQTPVMILDEPTAFLDYGSKVETLRLLQQMAHDNDKVILVSTHDLDIAARYADRLVTIDYGIRDISQEELKTIIAQ
jgi:iron complex transport system ATP-binding protein